MQLPRSVVALIRCPTYERDAVESAVRRGIDLLGGAGVFVKPNERILLKPNVLAPVTPEKAVTTHPEVMRAVAVTLKDAGAALAYGDSPGIPTGTVAGAMKRAGLAQVAQELDIPLADFDHGSLVAHPTGITSKRLFITNAVGAAQGVVSIPKLKTHGQTRFTGAVKNQYGCVQGLVKGEYHARFPDPGEFAQVVADVCALVNPRLYVMDGIVAMEGNGPQSGDPVNMGVLLFSRDPVALDAVACRLINLDPAHVPTCAAGEKAGLGTCDFGRIDITGDPWQDACCPGFRVVRRPPARVPANPFVRRVRNLTTRRPVIDGAKCSRCGVCIKMCPVDPKAIGWRRGDRTRPPGYTYDRCIRCFCCQEGCPSRAITIRRPLVGRLVPFASFLGLLATRVAARKEAEAARLAGSSGEGGAAC